MVKIHVMNLFKGLEGVPVIVPLIKKLCSLNNIYRASIVYDTLFYKFLLFLTTKISLTPLSLLNLLLNYSSC